MDDLVIHSGLFLEGSVPLVVTLDGDCVGKFFVFIVNGKKKIWPKKSLSRSLKREVYRINIPNLKGRVVYPENNLRFLENTSESTFRIWEVALISQQNHFFLSIQDMYGESGCFVEEGRLVCPQLSNWDQMLKIFGRRFRVSDLPSITSYSPVEISADGLESNTALVHWYNRAQGWGALVTPDGEARVHWSQVQVEEGEFAGLVKGQLIRYQGLRKLDPVIDGTETFFQEATRVTMV